MPVQFCDAEGCSRTVDRKNPKRQKITFFALPEDSVRSIKWYTNIEIKVSSRKRKFLCSDHFEDDAFTDSFRKRIHHNAIPTKQWIGDDRPKEYNCLGERRPLHKTYSKISRSIAKTPVKNHVVNDPEPSLSKTLDNSIQTQQENIQSPMEIKAPEHYVGYTMNAKHHYSSKICAAKGCGNTYPKSGISFFAFPDRDPKRVAEWMRSIEMKSQLHKERKHLCSIHFEDRCFTNTFRNRLTRFAVPTFQTVSSSTIQKSMEPLDSYEEWILPDYSTLEDSVVVAEVSLCTEGQSHTSSDKMKSNCVWKVKKIDHSKGIDNQEHSSSRVDSDDELLMKDVSTRQKIQNDSPRFSAEPQKSTKTVFKPEILELKPSFVLDDQRKSSNMDPPEPLKNLMNSSKVLLNSSGSASDSHTNPPKSSVAQTKSLEPSSSPRNLPNPSENVSKPEVCMLKPSVNGIKGEDFGKFSNVLLKPSNIGNVSKPPERIDKPPDTISSSDSEQQKSSKESSSVNPVILNLPFNLTDIDKPIKLSICIDSSAHARLIGTYRMGPDEPKNKESADVSQTEDAETELHPVSFKAGGSRGLSTLNCSSKKESKASSDTSRSILSEISSSTENEVYKSYGGGLYLKSLRHISDFDENDMDSAKAARKYFSLASSHMEYQTKQINCLRADMKRLTQKLSHVEKQLAKARETAKTAKGAIKDIKRSTKRSPKVKQFHCKPEYLYLPNKDSTRNVPVANDSLGPGTTGTVHIINVSPVETMKGMNYFELNCGQDR